MAVALVEYARTGDLSPWSLSVGLYGLFGLLLGVAAGIFAAVI
jgi:hypothetical protein